MLELCIDMLLESSFSQGCGEFGLCQPNWRTNLFVVRKCVGLGHKAENTSQHKPQQRKVLGAGCWYSVEGDSFKIDPGLCRFLSCFFWGKKTQQRHCPQKKYQHAVGCFFKLRRHKQLRARSRVSSQMLSILFFRPMEDRFFVVLILIWELLSKRTLIWR